VCGGGKSCGTGEDEWRRLRWGYKADDLHIPLWNRTKKPLATTLNEAGRETVGVM
jgi:hypothetical protein